MRVVGRGILVWASIFVALHVPARAGAGQGRGVAFPNGDFEQGAAGWSIPLENGDIGISAEHSYGGGHALRVAGVHVPGGAKVEVKAEVKSPVVPWRGPGLAAWRGKVMVRGGHRISWCMRQWDDSGKKLPTSWGELEGPKDEWGDILETWEAHERTARVQLGIIVYSWPAGRHEFYLDDLEIVRPDFPWPGRYKLRPDEHDRLTAADVAGPDGVVYPNWRQVGVQGGIPETPVRAELEAFGAKPGRDIADALEKACRDLAGKGGGALLIGPGTFFLDCPVTIRDSGLVIRGAGPDRTRIVFRYAAKQAGDGARGALYFFGKGLETPRHYLASDGRRGDTVLTFVDAGDFAVGDKFDLHAPLSDRFCNRVWDSSPRGWNRVGYFEIVGMDGNKITINQPLRIDFPAADGAYARCLNPVEDCGVEDLCMEHTQRLPIDSINFNWAWNCWARNLKIVRTGRNGVFATHSKWIEVRDCELDGSWNNGGGQAYAGFTRSADCLMDNCVVRKYRHAPCVQFGAMGCVFRNSRFIGSDMQWHAGWSTENLFENCVVESRHGYGSYGYGAYATGSSDHTHGPNGPRNVVYNCDVTSVRAGVLLRGSNEGWLFLHNRFRVKRGPGFVADNGSFDHIIRNNTFVLEDGKSPMVHLKTPDCTGIDLVNNRLYGGNGKLYDGPAALAREEGNQAHPAPGAEPPPRPEADPPSIYEWQTRR